MSAGRASPVATVDRFADKGRARRTYLHRATGFGLAVSIAARSVACVSRAASLEQARFVGAIVATMPRARYPSILERL
jgi:hypothetical protein